MADEFLAQSDSLTSKAAYLDSLFAMNGRPSEFLEAKDDRSFFSPRMTSDQKAVFDALEQDDAKYSPSKRISEEKWKELSEGIVFHYCNEVGDVVFPIDSIASNIYPMGKGTGWITDRNEITNWFYNHPRMMPILPSGQRGPDTDPRRILEMLKKVSYVAFISNDCILHPYVNSIMNSFNPGAARLNIVVFDLNDRSGQPIATLKAFGKNSSHIDFTETQHNVNGYSFKTNNASEQVEINLQETVANEVKRAVYKCLSARTNDSN